MQFTYIIAALASTAITAVLAGPMPEPVPDAAIIAARTAGSMQSRDLDDIVPDVGDVGGGIVGGLGIGDININGNNWNNNGWNTAWNRGWNGNNWNNWNNNWNNGWNTCGSVSCWVGGCNPNWGWNGQRVCTGGWQAGCPCW